LARIEQATIASPNCWLIPAINNFNAIINSPWSFPSSPHPANSFPKLSLSVLFPFFPQFLFLLSTRNCYYFAIKSLLIVDLLGIPLDSCQKSSFPRSSSCNWIRFLSSRNSFSSQQSSKQSLTAVAARAAWIIETSRKRKGLEEKRNFRRQPSLCPIPSSAIQPDSSRRIKSTIRKVRRNSVDVSHPLRTGFRCRESSRELLYFSIILVYEWKSFLRGQSELFMDFVWLSYGNFDDLSERVRESERTRHLRKWWGWKFDGKWSKSVWEVSGNSEVRLRVNRVDWSWLIVLVLLFEG
jgi:hypothetical protein